ncbi:hypothetical protein OIU78_008307 [Salix suchowensis]|nr:hypothetical protein OIU78_008307 [Salix suchowensis]
MGSFLSVSSSQLNEIVAGVHNSGVRFLWVSRGETTLFKDGCGDMGQVVPWVDHLTPTLILSSGAFHKVGPDEQIDYELSSGSINYFQWLDSQAPGSVLYVSLGSFFSISSKQMDEIASGLRNSGVGYLWVARGEALRLKENCGEKGIVVPWCD